MNDLIHNANIGVVDAFLNSVPKEPIEAIESLFSWDIMETEAYFGNPLFSEDTNGILDLSLIDRVEKYDGDTYFRQSGDWKCLTRVNNEGSIDSEFGQIFHKKSYETISNAMLEDIVSDYLAVGCNVEHVGEFKGGRIVYVQLSSDQLGSRLIGGHDENKGLITLMNSHDGSFAFTVKLDLFRIFCSNQFSAIKKARSNCIIRHTKSANIKLDELRTEINSLSETYNRIMLNIDLLNNVPIGHDSKFFGDLNFRRDFFIELLQVKKQPVKEERSFSRFNPLTVKTEMDYTTRAKNRLNALERAYNHQKQSTLGHNLWRLLNAVTFHVDHDRLCANENQRSKGYSMVGKGAELKQRAYKLLLEKAHKFNRENRAMDVTPY